MPVLLKEGRWWSEEGGTGAIRCGLCPHECRIKNGRTGVCGVRKNVDMRLYTINYGRVCVAVVDSIEKKPIFHFRPGSTLYSVGTIGCNLDCAYCQNYGLVRGNFDNVPFREMDPQGLVREALSKEVDGIGWTFNEPTVWAEYVIDASAEGRRKNLYSMINTNGFITKKAREDLLPHIDVLKVDVKGFREEFYRNVCNGSLDPVLGTCIAAKEYGAHVELAYLMIPQLNDSDEEMRDFSEWTVGAMGADVPVHFFRFSPAFRLSHLPQESLDRMRLARAIARRAGLKFVYLGGLISSEEQLTRCPKCGAALVYRKGMEHTEKIFAGGAQMSRFCPSFSEVKVDMTGPMCPHCGEPIKIRLY